MIHLSHAKNLALFGSIGLSPGDRTEAMSSPLNYLISQVWFLLSPNLSYRTYLDIYNIVVLIFFSLAFAICVLEILKKTRKVNKSIYWIVSFLPLAMVLASWTTFGWMISGMENALSASLLLLLLGLSINPKESRFKVVIFLITLLGIARIEFAILLLPLFSGLLYFLRGSKATINRLVLDISPIFLIWGFIHGARFFYFGQLSPNTAQALGKSANLSMAVYLITQFILLSKVIGLTKSLRSSFGMLVGAIHFGSLALVIYSNFGRSNFHLAPSLVVTTLVIIIAITAYSRIRITITLQIFILVLIGQLNEYFLFGPARLSEFRIVAIFIPALLVLSLMLFLEILQGSNFSKKDLTVLLALPLIPLAFLVLTKGDPVRNLCCKISPSENLIIREISGFLQVNDLPETTKPISASPDLGKVSFAKKAIIVDLGLIGDPLLGKLTITEPGKVANFLNDFVMPDLVETHGFWSCRYSRFLESEEFKKNYRLSYQGIVSTEFNSPPQSECPFAGKYTIWTRILPMAELDFARKLASTSNADFPDIVESEVSNCVQESKELKRCQYVYRGLLREIERINNSGITDLIFRSLNQSPTYKFDRTRLEKRGNWVRAAEREALNLIG